MQDGKTSACSPVRDEHMLLIGFKNEALKPLIGKTLAEVAKRARQIGRGNASST